MTLPAFHLPTALANYSRQAAQEQAVVQRFLDLLKHPDAYQRSHLPGHITGSAFIVSPDHLQTLLVHHAKLNRWLQPGGHCDGDEVVTRVALREGEEETGLLTLRLDSSNIFDLDIHPIPQRKDFPAHDHYDVRFLVYGNPSEAIVVSEESFDVRWVALSRLEDFSREASVLRMRSKLPAINV
jgi:8-oxo-dGTP pyrophosphatase MutT (NUDIX family)